MSSPMFDLPEHFPIPVNADGDGPVAWLDAHAVVCWCGDPTCSVVTQIRDR